MSTDPVKVAVYARISEDTTGDAAGVRRQLDEARTLAEANGWDVVAEEVDNDLSALKGGERPGYEAILSLVRAGAIERVVVWQTSRLLRNRRERAEAIELFGKQRVGIIAVKGISFDLSTAYGRGQAGLMGEFDTMESEVKAERVASAAAQRAQDGRPSGYLGYGWQKEGTGANAVYTEHPHQAAVVREIVDRLLAGESLLGITASLNKRGEPSPESALWANLDDDERARRVARGRKAPSVEWGKTSVKKLALRESNVCVRVHRRGRPDETRYVGNWPALVDQSKHERVRALLMRPERRTNQTVARPGARRWLLTWGNVSACGACGKWLRVKEAKRYVCVDGCVGRDIDFVDTLVREVVLARLSQPDALDWLLGDDEAAKRLADEINALHARLAEATDMFASGEIDRAQLARITAVVQPELERAERAHQSATSSLDLDALRPLAGPKAAERWEALTVAQQRAVLETIGLQVVLHKSEKRGRIYLVDGTPGPGYDPESIAIKWRRS